MAGAEKSLVSKHGSSHRSTESWRMPFARRWLIAVAIVFCTVLGLSVYIVNTAPEFNQYNLLKQYRPERVAHGPRTILLWNSFFGDRRWSLPDDTLGPGFFRDELHCPVHRCEVTNVHHFLPRLDMFDAILFHNTVEDTQYEPMPRERSEQQLYVFALMGVPREIMYMPGDQGGFYNLTMTYRLDSDIVWPYQHVEDLSSGQVVAPHPHPHWRQPPAQWNDTEVWRLWAGKSKTVAWFVSHCETLSKREELAAELAKFMKVDIFGKCGTQSCSRGSDACDQMIDHDYKFYLSFENALCTDYVTEKFYNALRRQVVPVVFGGANYTRFAPPHSYIDAESFASVAELAKYLKYLDEHPAEYMRYFWWRQHYRLVHPSPFCDLCEKLHSKTYRHKSQTYRNLNNWGIGSSCRFESNIRW